jgi:preprotein translocase subunit YajC
MKYIAFALATSALIAAPSFAQMSTPTSTPAAAPQAAPATDSAAAPAAATPNVTAGAQVADASGGAVGTIESVSGSNAVLSTGTAKATLPVTAFAAAPNGGLVIGMTKAEVEAAVAKAGGGAQSASATAPAGKTAPAASQTAMTAPTSITVGATVNDTKGGVVGKVAAVSGDLVTVATANAKAQLPKNAFAQGENGLVIAMTASELEAAAKGAGAQKKTGA